MSTQLRNRRITADEIAIHLFDRPRRSVWVDDGERAAYAETRDAAPPPYGGGLSYGEDERPHDAELLVVAVGRLIRNAVDWQAVLFWFCAFLFCVGGWFLFLALLYVWAVKAAR